MDVHMYDGHRGIPQAHPEQASSDLLTFFFAKYGSVLCYDTFEMLIFYICIKAYVVTSCLNCCEMRKSLHIFLRRNKRPKWAWYCSPGYFATIYQSPPMDGSCFFFLFDFKTTQCENHFDTNLIKIHSVFIDILSISCSVLFLVTADRAILECQMAKNQFWLYAKIIVTQSC